MLVLCSVTKCVPVGGKMLACGFKRYHNSVLITYKHLYSATLKESTSYDLITSVFHYSVINNTGFNIKEVVFSAVFNRQIIK